MRKLKTSDKKLCEVAIPKLKMRSSCLRYLAISIVLLIMFLNIIYNFVNYDLSNTNKLTPYRFRNIQSALNISSDGKVETILVVHDTILKPDLDFFDTRILNFMTSLKKLGYHVVYFHFRIDENAEIKHSEALSDMNIEVWGPLTENYQFLRSHIEIVKPFAVFEWIRPSGEYLAFLQSLNKIVYAYSLYTAIITVSDDIMSEQFSFDTIDNSTKQISSLKVLESFLLDKADVRLANNVTVQKELLKRDSIYNSYLLPCTANISDVNSIEELDCKIKETDVVEAIKLSAAAVNQRNRLIPSLAASRSAPTHINSHYPIKVLLDLTESLISYHFVGLHLLEGIVKLNQSKVKFVGRQGCGDRDPKSLSHYQSPDVFVSFLGFNNSKHRPWCCAEATCKYIVYQPWEVGYIPKSWVAHIKSIDAVWVPSSYAAEAFLAKGSIEAHKVQVVPQGVDCLQLQQKSNELRLKWNIRPRTKLFLYVGSTLPREGIPTLIKSWIQAFKSHDDVALVINTVSYPYDVTISNLIHTTCINEDNKDLATIIHDTEQWSNISNLYSSADVLVNTARAEGFGRSTLEALAAGKVVIAPDSGATNDYLSASFAQLVKSRRSRCRIYPCSQKYFCDYKTARCEELEDFPHWSDMNIGKLHRTMHKVKYVKPHDYQTHALWGRKFVCEHFSWETSAHIALHKIESVWTGRYAKSMDSSPINIWNASEEFRRAEGVLRESKNCDLCHREFSS